MSKRKYERGDRINSIYEFLEQELIWWMGKVYCKGFAYSWQLQWIIQRISYGQFYKVVKKPVKSKDGDHTDPV